MRCLRLGFGEHYLIAHGKESSKELARSVWASKLVREVDEELLKEIKRRPKEAKWDYYGLFQ